MGSSTTIAEILRSDSDALLQRWLALQAESARTHGSPLGEDLVRQQSAQFLQALAAAVRNGDVAPVSGPEWREVRDLLNQIATVRSRYGLSPSETATFVFSLKQPVFEQIRRRLTNADDLADAVWTATVLFDRLGLMTTDFVIEAREDVVKRQRAEMLELSTPVVTLWRGVLALPLIGTLDSERTQVVMESLLERIVESGATIAILDITGVPTVDTLVAQHLLKTVAAARLMGADCIVSGIRPQIAQTIVHLGVDLTSVITKATLADAFEVALQRLGLSVGQAPARRPSPAAPEAAEPAASS